MDLRRNCRWCAWRKVQVNQLRKIVLALTLCSTLSCGEINPYAIAVLGVAGYAQYQLCHGLLCSNDVKCEGIICQERADMAENVDSQ